MEHVSQFAGSKRKKRKKLTVLVKIYSQPYATDLRQPFRLAAIVPETKQILLSNICTKTLFIP